MKNILLFSIAILILVVAGFAFYKIGNTPNNNIPQELTSGTMERFEFFDKLIPAPAAAFYDENGNEKTFADYKGKVILVNLWATWCAPCKKEMPDLNELQKSMNKDEFEVVLLSVNQDGLESSLEFLEQYQITHLKTFHDKKRKIARSFKSQVMPTSVLINAEGNMVGRLIGEAKWDSDEAKSLISYIIKN